VPTIDADLVKALTPGGLLLLLVLLMAAAFISGLIRPRSAIKEVREDRDARLADKDRQIADWREAHRESEEAREVQAAALRESLEATRATAELLKAWRAAAALSRDESER
jgi:ABC-type transport system involved in cytochrome bd biosynthesis fused ATPase/permease subunit